MSQCNTCGNDYDKTFQIIKNGQTYTFDSFECAITRLAPVCEHCQVRIIGHGLEVNELFYCCHHCARQSGVEDITSYSNARRFDKAEPYEAVDSELIDEENQDDFPLAPITAALWQEP